MIKIILCAETTVTIDLLSLTELRRVASGPHLLTLPMKLMSMIMKEQWMDCKTESFC